MTMTPVPPVRIDRTARSGAARRVALGLAALLVLVVAGGLVFVLRPHRAPILAPPAPTTAPDVAAAEPLPMSTAAVPITVGLGPLAARLERAVPTRFGSLRDRMPVRGAAGLSIALALRRSPFHVSFVGDQVIVHATVSYALKAWYVSNFLPPITASCGNGGPNDPRLSLTVQGPVSIRQDWSLHTHARLSELKPATASARDRCRVSSVGLDVTGEVVRQARAFLESHAGAVDSALAHVDVRGPVSASWHVLQQPVPLGDSLWLLVHPQAVRRGPIRGLGDSVEVTLSLDARPRVVVGPRPEASDLPLPPLGAGPVSPHLDLTVEGRASYPEASRLLQRELGGTRVQEMGRTVRLDSLKVFGIGAGKLALEVHVGGDATGVLYLTGTPRVDSTGQITIPDLDFDVHTRDLVLRAESWLGSGPLRRLLRRRARWPQPADVARIRASLQRELNRSLSKGVRLAGTVDRVRIVGIQATREALVVRAAATGTAALSVTRY